MKLTVSAKITLGFGLGIAALAMLGGYAFLAISSLHGHAQRLSQTAAEHDRLHHFNLDHIEWGTEVLEGLIASDITELDVEVDPRLCKLGQWYYGGGRQEMERISPYLGANLAALEKPHDELHHSVARINEVLKGERDGAQQLYRQSTAPALAQIQTLFHTMLADLARTELDAGGLVDEVARDRYIMAVIALLLTLLMAAVALALGRDIRRVLIGAVTRMSTSVSQIGVSADEHGKVLEQQVTAVSETTSTMDELDAVSRRATEQAEAAAGTAGEGAEKAEQGGEMVADMLGSMDELRQKVETIGEQILRLSEQTGQIDKIISDVTDIADQTNLLALNAAVEAVRAGEQGKGFAVVAQEIRKLADQSKKSARRISTLVEDVQKVTNGTVMAAEDGTKTLDEAAATVAETGQVFNVLVDSVGMISENVKQISLSTKQQSGAIAQVVEAMNSLNSGAKQSSAGVQQTRAGLEQMDQLAQEIRQII